MTSNDNTLYLNDVDTLSPVGNRGAGTVRASYHDRAYAIWATADDGACITLYLSEDQADKLRVWLSEAPRQWLEKQTRERWHPGKPR
jgi:hypothetical protein